MRIIKWVGVVVVTLAVVAVAGLPVLKSKAMARFDQQFDIPVKDLPVPFPLSPQELAAVGADELVDVAEIAYRRALQRGEHYLKSRAACADCHGADYGGDVIADNPVLGRWVAPNITRGGVTADYTSEDWVRLIRHGVKPDGRPATMPSGDFTNFSDQEISDIVTYIESLPAIDRVMPPTVLGPAMAIMILNGEMAVSAEVIDHTAPRPVYPPAIAPTLELGAHLANTCTGCHGNNLSGGPIAGGDPSWPAAANLTFHDSGLANWTLDEFSVALRDGTRPDGRKLDASMPVAFTTQLSDDEVEGLYKYLQTVPKVAVGSR